MPIKDDRQIWVRLHEGRLAGFRWAYVKTHAEAAEAGLVRETVGSDGKSRGRRMVAALDADEVEGWDAVPTAWRRVPGWCDGADEAALGGTLAQPELIVDGIAFRLHDRGVDQGRDREPTEPRAELRDRTKAERRARNDGRKNVLLRGQGEPVFLLGL